MTVKLVVKKNDIYGYVLTADDQINEFHPQQGRINFDVKNLKYEKHISSTIIYNEIHTRSSLKGELKPNKDIGFHIIGEDIDVRDFSLSIEIADNKEGCLVDLSYDLVLFRIFLKKETFDELKNLVNIKNLSHFKFFVRDIKGFYQKSNKLKKTTFVKPIYLMPADYIIDNIDDTDEELINLFFSDKPPNNVKDFFFNYSTNRVIKYDNEGD